MECVIFSTDFKIFIFQLMIKEYIRINKKVFSLVNSRTRGVEFGLQIILIMLVFCFRLQNLYVFV